MSRPYGSRSVKVDELTKTCTKCGLTKPETEFYLRSDQLGKRRPDCKDCHKAQVTRNCRLRQDYWNERRQAQRYGMTADQYREMLALQDGCCAICRRKPTGRRLAVDHEHRTGRVRGLLCDACNRAIGQFGDDPTRIRCAAEYVDSGGCGSVVERLVVAQEVAGSSPANHPKMQGSVAG